jgi:hypothetical protein
MARPVLAGGIFVEQPTRFDVTIDLKTAKTSSVVAARYGLCGDRITIHFLHGMESAFGPWRIGDTMPV